MGFMKATNVKKIYQMGEVDVKALRGVSLTIDKGEFVVIVGPSGSGKSTLMHLLGALDNPTSGKIHIAGEDLSQMDEYELAMLRRNKMGFIFQSFNLIPTLSALENVMIPTEPMGKPREEVETRAIQLLKDVGLGDRMDHKPSELSGGQRQRVSIARALINNPEIIFADEPTGNLDSVTGEHVIEIMKNLNVHEKKTFVIVTHDETLLDFATSRFHLKDGLIEEIVNGGNKIKKYVD